MRGSYLCLNYSRNPRSQRETNKHLCPLKCLIETTAGILSSYCFSIVKTRNANFHAYICFPSVVAYVSFDSSLPQTLHWSLSILTKTHLSVQWICLLWHPHQRMSSQFLLSSLWPYKLFFSLHYVIGCQRMMNWRDTTVFNVWYN